MNKPLFWLCIALMLLNAVLSIKLVSARLNLTINTSDQTDSYSYDPGLTVKNQHFAKL